jgi:NYN domain
MLRGVAKPRAIAYIDGFNFYHGVARDSPDLKWLNFEALCDELLKGYDVVAVNYYTAKVKDRPADPSQSQRQNDYLRALTTCPRTNIILGQFQRKKSTVDATAGQQVLINGGGTGTLDAGQTVRGKVWEEKGSDVNLGVDLSWDAAAGGIHTALVVSNDLDLQRAVTRAMQQRVQVIVVNPHHRTHGRPSLVGSDTRKLSRAMLLRAQFPDPVVLGKGREVRRPAAWS